MHHGSSSEGARFQRSERGLRKSALQPSHLSFDFGRHRDLFDVRIVNGVGNRNLPKANVKPVAWRRSSGIGQKVSAVIQVIYVAGDRSGRIRASANGNACTACANWKDCCIRSLIAPCEADELFQLVLGVLGRAGRQVSLIFRGAQRHHS